VFRVDREGKFLELRANDDSKLYVSREAIVDRDVRDMLPPAIAEGDLRCIARTLETGDVQIYEYKLPVSQDVLDFEARMVVSGANEVLCLVRDVTERKQAERALRRQNGYLAALHETALDLMHRLEPSDLLKAIVARAGALMGTPHGYVYLLETGGAELEMRVGVGVYEEYVGYRLNPGEGLAGKVQKSGQSLIVEDYTAWEGHSAKFDRDGFRAVVGVPLKSGSEVVGVIGLAYLEENRTFGDDELALLTRFAELASIALDNARLYVSRRSRRGSASSTRKRGSPTATEPTLSSSS
jgi:transcriptional regulator with GAF, ATPase, and Fis domain